MARRNRKQEEEEEEEFLLSDEEYVQLDLQGGPNRAKEKNTLLDRIKSVPHVGYVLMAVAASTNTTVGLLVKELDSVDPFLLICFRGVIISSIAVPYIACHGITAFPEGRLKVLTIRGASFIFFMGALFYGFR